MSLGRTVDTVCVIRGPPKRVRNVYEYVLSDSCHVDYVCIAADLARLQTHRPGYERVLTHNLLDKFSQKKKSKLTHYMYLLRKREKNYFFPEHVNKQSSL